jgi:plastocyanin
MRSIDRLWAIDKRYERSEPRSTSKRSGSFNTGDIQPGRSKYFTAPTASGTYQYLCSIHNFMTGEIKVKAK